MTSWGSGGYGLVLNADMRTGGIYYNFNNPMPVMNFRSDKVGIGAIPPETGKFKLYVTGGILTEEVLVKLQSQWSDYVFDDNYKLRGLQDVELFIKQNRHLPEVQPWISTGNGFNVYNHINVPDYDPENYQILASNFFGDPRSELLLIRKLANID